MAAKKQAEPKGSAPKQEATPGGVARPAKLPREAGGPLIQRRRERNGPGINDLPFPEILEAQRAHHKTAPGLARKRLLELLDAAMFDEVIAKSEQYVWLAFQMREWATETDPGDTAATMLECLETATGKVAGARGGRPSKEDVWAKWRDQVEDLKRTKRSLATAQERYEEVAAAWVEAGNRRIGWKTVQSGINKLKRRQTSQK